MVLEDLPPPFVEWISAAAIQWFWVVLLVAVVCGAGTFLACVLQRGPLAGPRAWLAGLGGGLMDLLRIAPRRVWALAWLAIQEALHRRVLVAFGIFVAILLFAGWYLDQGSRNLAELYLSFVMNMTCYLVLFLALFLSVLSLPADITQRTIHTIVTKPVRSSEVILGRVLGFVLVGTALLAITAAVSYVFVVRGLSHVHTIEVAGLVEVPPRAGVANPIVRRGSTSFVQGHAHEVLVYADGTAQVAPKFGHDHPLEQVQAAGQTAYRVGGPRGSLSARVPVYGTLMFRDRQGAATSRGVNTGDEWMYRSFIEGSSLAAAVWTFEGLAPERFPNGLPLEMTLQVFRTYKGDVERPIQGAIRLRNPITGLTSQAQYFSAKEFDVGSEFVPRKMLDSEGRVIDLFNDLVDSGRLELEIKCLDPQQYFGMAQADVYIRATEASFAANFVKGYLGIWLQMLVVITFGVMFSTFLNGSVAMLATVAALLGGFFLTPIRDLAEGNTLGGGPLESMVRLVTQRNLVIELEPSAGTDVVKVSDQAFQWILQGVTALLPEFGRLNDIDYVAKGYDIPADVLTMHLCTAVGYVLPALVLGFWMFRSREVAR